MTDKKSGILLMVFAILSAYTHHYGLAAAGAINLMLLIYSKKNKLLGRWFKMAFIQVAAFSFGLYLLVQQFASVAGGFWISMSYPNFVYETVTFFLIGELPEDIAGVSKVMIYVYYAISFLFLIAVISLYRIFRKKHSEQLEPALLALKVLGIVIAFFFAVSLINPFYYVRYLMVLWGIIVFFFSFILGRVNSRVIKALILIVLSATLFLRTMPVYQEMYSSGVEELDTFMQENIKEGDIIVSENLSIMVLAVKYTDNQMAFYNSGNWGVEDAYSCYLPNMQTLRDISDFIDDDCRIWVLNSSTLCNYITEKTGKTIVSEYDTIINPYHNLEFDFTLME